MKTITVLKGDGIGPEISSQVVRILESLHLDLRFEQWEIGEACLAKTGALIPQAVFDSIERNKIVLKAPITTPIGTGFKSLNVQLRKKYDLYANIRLAKSMPNIKTPFKNINIVTFRENTEDLYIGEEVMIKEDEVHAIKKITRQASERIIHAAFQYAKAHKRKKVTCVHKANILKLSDGMFLRIFNEIKQQYPQIETNDMIVDNVCMQLVMYPEKFDVMVMPNLYGDIISDLTSGLIGGLGLLPSSNIGDEFTLFEAVHGSAPDIAGQNKANPIALLLAACLMLDYLEYPKEANRIRKAIDDVLIENRIRTCDLGGTASTSEFTDALLERM
ncbi:MAG: isocitrate/isopropylmalate dehydrogenase family protein [Breznakia sp.]